MKQLNANRIIAGVAIFLAITVVLNNLPDDQRGLLLPILMFGIFVRAAIKAPPIAILILLYYSMIQGGWLILAAAPVTMLLARRYQRQRLQLELNPDHIRRTVLVALAALAATIPFIAASVGAWSSRSRGAPSSSASPLVSRPGPGEESVLRRFAEWLGFGPNGELPQNLERLEPVPVRPLQPDEPFNWWIVVLAVIIVAMLVLAWWLWRRLRQQPEVFYGPVAAEPLARLEAVGERVGRPRRENEGAITYGRVLAERTGDTRLAQVGPLVSGQVYQSAFANPRQVGNDLSGLESAPPPVPPTPPWRERLAERRTQLPSNRTIGIGVVAVLALVLAGWLLVPKLGRLQQPRQVERGIEQLHAGAPEVPSIAQVATTDVG